MKACVASIWYPPPISIGFPKSEMDEMKLSSAAVRIAGMTSGKVMVRNTRNGPAPSI